MNIPIWVNTWIIKDKSGKVCYQGLDFSTYESANDFLKSQSVKLEDFNIVQKDF